MYMERLCPSRGYCTYPGFAVCMCWPSGSSGTLGQGPLSRIYGTRALTPSPVARRAALYARPELCGGSCAPGPPWHCPALWYIRHADSGSRIL